MIQVNKDGSKCHECKLKSRAVQQLRREDLEILENACGVERGKAPVVLGEIRSNF